MFINNLFNHLQNYKQTRQPQISLVFPVIFLLLFCCIVAGAWFYAGSVVDIILASIYIITCLASGITIIIFNKKAKLDYFYQALNVSMLSILVIFFFTLFISYDLSINEEINPLWAALLMIVPMIIGIISFFIIFNNKEIKLKNIDEKKVAKSTMIVATLTFFSVSLMRVLNRSGVINFDDFKYLFFYILCPILSSFMAYGATAGLMLFKYKQQLLALEQQYYYNYNSYNNINQL